MDVVTDAQDGPNVRFRPKAAVRLNQARAQYWIASTLDLSVADKAELARDMGR